MIFNMFQQSVERMQILKRIVLCSQEWHAHPLKKIKPVKAIAVQIPSLWLQNGVANSSQVHFQNL